MYRHILGLSERFFGDKAEYVLAAAFAVLSGAVLLLLSRPWRQAVADAQQRGEWRAVVLTLADSLMTLVVGGAIISALGAAMLVQSTLFDERHGLVTQRNYEAIKTNWGPPHEQRELVVTHYVTEEQTVLLFKDGRQVPEDELGTGDENRAGENPVRVKRKVRKVILQNSIVRGRAIADVRMNYRQKGSAFYTCYEDSWQLVYTVRNRSDKATEAEFRFPMPADQGTYSEFTIAVDGRNWGEHLVFRDNAQTWKMPMQPDQMVEVRVTYSSRGMEYLRYTPAPMAHREDYEVTVRIFPDRDRGPRRFVWNEHMGLPVGSMTPTTIKDSESDGGPMVLHWDLQSAATSLAMGVILPQIKQPGFYVARLLHEAPLGLALLAGAMVVTWKLLGRPTDLFGLAVLAVGYYLFYTLAAYLSDHLTSFRLCFVLSAAATMLLALAYLRPGWGPGLATWQTSGLMAALTVYYPLAVVLDRYTGLLVQILYWSLAAYAAMLAVARVWALRRATPA